MTAARLGKAPGIPTRTPRALAITCIAAILAASTAAAAELAAEDLSAVAGFVMQAEDATPIGDSKDDTKRDNYQGSGYVASSSSNGGVEFTIDASAEFSALLGRNPPVYCNFPFCSLAGQHFL